MDGGDKINFQLAITTTTTLITASQPEISKKAEEIQTLFKKKKNNKPLAVHPSYIRLDYITAASQ